MKKEILPTLMLTMMLIIFWGTIQAQPLSVTITSTNITCFGDNTGSATANPTGGAPPYTYFWSIGQSTATINNLWAGTYAVTVTDQNFSTANAIVTITEAEPIELSSEVMNVSCYGANDGSIGVTASNGEPPYSFSWSNGSTESYLDNLPAGPYDVTVTDDDGCKNFADHNITQPSELLIDLVDLNHEICSGTENGSITISLIGGDSPYTVLWSNGSPGLTLNNLAPDSYSVTVTDDNDCSKTATFIINPGNTVEIELLQIQDVLCYGNSTGAISILASEGNTPYTYSWSNGYTSPSINNIPADVYVVTVNDEDNCTATANYEVNQPTDIVIDLEELQNETCDGENDGSITIQLSGGIAPYLVQWSNGMEELSIDNLAPGVYTVTTTDDTGCQKTEAYEIYSGNSIQANLQEAQNISCHGGSNGSLSLSASGGNAPYSYLWSNGMTGPSINGLMAGTYTATITDAYGCAGSEGFTLNEPMPISISIAQTSQNPCFGDTIADLSATVTGGIPAYAAIWSDGNTGLQNSNLHAGTYTISITDANACLAIQSVTIIDPVLLTTTLTTTNETAFDANDGTATTVPAGGTPGYSFLWSNGANTSTISGLSPGSYTVTITDINGCTVDGTEQVLAFGCTLDVMSGADFSICEDDTVMITPLVTGASGNVSYLWADSSTAAFLQVMQGGEYCVTVTDGANCQNADCIVIVESIIPPLTCPATDESAPGANDGAVQCDSLPGITSYLWSNDSTTSSIVGLSPGQYCVTVTHQSGCIATQCFYVQPGNCQMTVDTVINNVLCAGDSTGAIILTTDNGTAPITYIWSNGETTNEIENLSAGYYAVTVSDASGCVEINSFTISQPDSLTVDIDSIAAAGTSCTGLVMISASGGVPPYTYQWTDPSEVPYNTEDLHDLHTPGFYTLIILDKNNCTFFDTVYVDICVAVNPSPSSESIKVYPVPAKDILFIDTERLVSEVWISGVDGRVFKRIIQPQSNRLDITDLVHGWYVLRIRMGNEWHVARIVK